MNKLKKSLAAFLLGILAVAQVGQQATVQAAGNGAYTVSVSYSYKNPETGKTADGSTNIALGESMIGSMLESTALIEEVDGKTYVTLGIGLMSNVSNVRVMTQKSSGSYAQASITKTGSGTKSGDTVNHYRFAVSSTDRYISPILYIDPMGRDVQFYVSLKMDTKKSGTGNYNALLVSSEAEETKAPKATATPKATEKATKAPKATEKPAAEATEAAGTAEPTNQPEQTEVPTEAPVEAATEAPTEAPTERATAAPEITETKKDNTISICIAIIAVSVIGTIAAVGGHFYMERKRKGKDDE